MDSCCLPRSSIYLALFLVIDFSFCFYLSLIFICWLEDLWFRSRQASSSVVIALVLFPRIILNWLLLLGLLLLSSWFVLRSSATGNRASSGEVDTNRWNTRYDRGRVAFWVILAHASDCKVDVGLILDIDVCQIGQKSLHDLLLFLGFLGHAHDSVEVDGCAALHNISDLQTLICLLQVGDEVCEGHGLGLADFPSVPEGHFETLEQLFLDHGSRLASLHYGHGQVQEDVSEVGELASLEDLD